MNAPEWKHLFVGCIGSGLWGAYSFMYGIAFGRIYEVSSVAHDISDPNIGRLVHE
jgi:hypothetical protein